MNLHIQTREGIDKSAWDDLAGQYSFFQTIAWVDICLRGITGSEALFLIIDYNGRPVAGMPGLITGNFGSTSFLSMPYDTYGGIAFHELVDDRARAVWQEELLNYCSLRRFGKTIIVDFSSEMTDMASAGFSRQLAFTHIIDLRGVSQYSPPDKKIAGHLRKGERSGLRIERITTSACLSDFYEIYAKTERRHGRKRPRHPKRFFAAIFDVLGGSSQLLWLAALHEETMIGAQINFVQGGTLFNWQTVSDFDYRSMKPNHILLKHAIDFALEHNIDEVNLGASPAEAEGLIDYKERWGGQKREYGIYIKRRGLRRLVGR
jgi:hypothetical protein